VSRGVTLINHRRHDHEAGCAELFAVLHVADGAASIHLRHAADHRHATGGHFDGVFDHRTFFLRLEALVFTQRAAHDQSGHADVDLRLPMPCGGCEIERLILVELREDCREDTGPHLGFLIHES
jgi:hypothetical protein